MKKFFLTLVLIAASIAANANAVRYFTRPQAVRVTAALDAENELMIYCGYEYELATYVIVNEVWMEPVNSKYYEIWLYGYDAYTGEEVYMPIDLSCIWLYNGYSHRMYSAAQYLRFRSTVSRPNFYWTMPPYNAFVRYHHDPMFNHMYTYHYEVHRYGWRPPAVPHGGHPPLPPYYMRTPHTPAYVPTRPFTPGVDHPRDANGHEYLGATRPPTNTRPTSFSSNGGARKDNISSNAGNPGTTNRGNGTSDNNTRGNNNSSLTPASTRGTNSTTTPTNTRGNNATTTPTNTRGNNSTTTPTNTRGNNSTTTPTNTRGNDSKNTSSSSTNRLSDSKSSSSSSDTREVKTSTSSNSNRGNASTSSNNSSREVKTTNSSSSRGNASTSSNSSSREVKTTNLNSSRGNASSSRETRSVNSNTASKKR